MARANVGGEGATFSAPTPRGGGRALVAVEAARRAVPMASVLHVQGLPTGRTAPKPARARPFDRLTSRAGLVFVAATERGAPEERFGLGAFVEFQGRSVLRAGVILPDGQHVAALRRWARGRVVHTVAGRAPIELQGLSEFFDRTTGLFTKRCYTGAGWLVGADLGRTFGLVAMAPLAGRPWPSMHKTGWSGGFALWLPTWAKFGDKGALVYADGNRPQLRCRPMGAHGWSVRFAAPPRGKGWGKVGPDGGAFEGRFVDIVSWAYALDGVDSGELADHLEAFGFGHLDYPAAVPVDGSGAERMARVAEAVHALALAVDEESARWLTSRRDRLIGVGRVDLPALASPAGLASEALRRAGVRSPLDKFDLSEELLSLAIGAHRGGWLSDELAGAGLFPAVDIDVRSAYPAWWSLLGGWHFVTAASLRERDVSKALRRLCVKAAAGDVAPLLDRRTWRRFGFTICQVVPDGEPWPVEAPDGDHPQGHAGMRTVSGDVSLGFAWPDVVLAALLSGRAPRVVSATRLVPVGSQEGLLRRWPLYDGTELDIADDPGVALVRLRDRAKARGDDRLAAHLRVVVNTLVYGNVVRTDTRPGARGVDEVTGEWCFPPMASTVTAASRLGLGLAEHLVNSAGGTVASRDTDGLLLVSSPGGGTVRLADGREVGAVSWATLDKLLARFDRLDPFGTGQPFWKVAREHEGRPLHGLVLGLKRYVLCTLDDKGDLAEVVEATEHALGGSVADPPAMAGRDHHGRHRWTRAVAAVAVRQAIAAQPGPGHGRPPLALGTRRRCTVPRSGP